MTIRLFPSLTGLIRLVQHGYDPLNDDNNCIYFFGCTREGLEETFSLYNASLEEKQIIADMLSKAESEGRVSFVNKDNGKQRDEYIRFEWLVNCFRDRNQSIKELDIKLLESEFNIVNHIPTLENWIWNSFVGVEVTTQATVAKLNLSA